MRFLVCFYIYIYTVLSIFMLTQRFLFQNAPTRPTPHVDPQRATRVLTRNWSCAGSSLYYTVGARDDKRSNIILASSRVMETFSVALRPRAGTAGEDGGGEGRPFLATRQYEPSSSSSSSPSLSIRPKERNTGGASFSAPQSHFPAQRVGSGGRAERIFLASSVLPADASASAFSATRTRPVDEVL